MFVADTLDDMLQQVSSVVFIDINVPHKKSQGWQRLAVVEMSDRR